MKIQFFPDNYGAGCFTVILVGIAVPVLIALVLAYV